MRSIRVGVAGCWVLMLACGGVVQRHGDEDGAAGSSNSSPSGASSRAGSAGGAGRMTTGGGSASTMGGSVSAGASSTPGGGATTTPLEPAACFNDTDCPGRACGGQVCNWTLSHPHPEGDKVFVCNPAGSQSPPGQDGWCTTDENCKCRGLGARCVAPYCSFTRP